MGCSVSGKRQPNVVLIFVDDMGYGDMARTGHPTIATPNLDRLADQGVMMTQFYSAAAVCSPSRAALLTGRYPIRTGITRVLFPHHKIGLPPAEKTCATLLKTKNYATACIGKWHLGHLPEFLPTSHGFDYYYGIPYSNDMYGNSMPPIPLMRNTEIIEQPCDQTTLTKRYTEESVKFIQENKNKPFFLYLAHTMPHIPLARSKEFEDRSKRGFYGDVIEEIDWSVGQIMETLKQAGVEKNTFLVFTSDNGPWSHMKQNGGSSGLLRGAKASTWEGGVREPFIARYPGVLPAGRVCTEVGTTMDLFASILAMADIPVPDDRPVDGKNIIPVLQGTEKSPHEQFFYYWEETLNAIRSGKYKLHFRKNIGGFNHGPCDPYELYDLLVDPSEQYDLAADMPDVVERLTAEAREFDRKIRELRENNETLERIKIWEQ
ncbi:sulfatase [candidate division KSB1 bacterium]|nr:sulfatase [candidate division KSB1 bacterium]